METYSHQHNKNQNFPFIVVKPIISLSPNPKAMKSGNKIYLITVLLTLFLAGSNYSVRGQQLSPDSNQGYNSKLISERQEKDVELKTTDNSPIDKDLRTKFNGLNYFAPDSLWVITANLRLFENPDTLAMKTTTDRLPLYLIYGIAEFEIHDTTFQLTVYRNIDLMKKPGYENYFFVPFRDYTSGEQSYGGGRYMDTYLTDSGQLILDFNRAYNPYCVYSKRYSCPLTPEQNYLNTYVTAGEKNYDH